MTDPVESPLGGATFNGLPPQVKIGELPTHAAVLAFVDILGFRSLVSRAFTAESEDRDALAGVLRFLAKKADDERELHSQASKHFQTKAFSDTIVISDEDTDAGFNRVAETAASIAASLLWRGRLCRGGIANGLLIHTDTVLVGPALVNAYDIEQKAAVYPRIVVAENLTRVPIKGRWNWYRDTDGLACIDVFHRMGQTKWNDKPVRDGLMKARAAIEAQLRAQENGGPLDVLSKYRWITGRFNLFANDRADLKLEPISIA
jgi:hypothetical protein